MARRDGYGVYFIFKSMEQGPTYRVSLPKYPSKDPHYRILAHQRSRFTHYYFYIRDEVLGPMVLLVARSFPSRPPIISTATASSSRSSGGRGSASASTTTPSLALPIRLRCRRRPTG